jgi:signal transduction histidine kinase/ActR/RegA family two-component response regulator
MEWSLPTEDALGRMASIALFAQSASALLLLGLFLLLARQGKQRRYFRSWTWAWAALCVALVMVILRYTISPVPDEKELAELEWHPLFGALYTIYAAGKLAFAGLLLQGALQCAGRATRRTTILLVIVLGAWCAAHAFVWQSLQFAVLWHAPAMAAATGAAAVLLFRIPLERRSVGTLFTASALAVLAALWLVYIPAFAGASADPEVIAPALAWAPWIAANNSLIDLLLQFFLAFGMVLVLMQELQREAHEARREAARVQAELARVEKLRAVGALVSGVAHELNNPLTSVLGFTELLLDKPRDPEEKRALLTVREQALRCREIVRGLLGLIHEGQGVRRPVDVPKTVARVLSAFEPELRRSGVRALQSYEARLPRVHADPGALEQVLTNLVSNALHAVGSGGELAVRARARGAFVEVAVEDDGPGLGPEALRRVFEPFFTTKAPGEGTGLGLALVHSIVCAHGGEIQAENRSAPARGARFASTWPVSSESSSGEISDVELVPRPGRGSAPPPAGGRRALVVDDEPSVRALLRELCERSGFEVEERTDGESALDRLLTQEVHFDVVLCDLRLGELSGIDVHDRLERLRSPILARTLFVTGDVAAAEARAFAERSRCRIVRKPFDVREFLRVLEETANAPSSTSCVV